MKRTFFLAFGISCLCLLSSCKDDNYIEWKLLNDEWWEQHKNDSGYSATDSGLRYRIIYKGGINNPDENSGTYVRYNNKIRLIDGEIAMELTNAGAYISDLPKGFIEGIRKIGTGGIIEMMIPYSLAYGKSGLNANVPPYSHVICEVELLFVLNN
ncbi:MAG: FKBP-type peptidyl-prolyl cis-trans isomerase [Prevotellaceae bacterium]|jgi:FKBP-type peptidyl-prolyl cis-trans isomerase|nr:FKBP-type peptidyl-prolyl cis-trans isomerase [Prevotellaceae bacterium]